MTLPKMKIRALLLPTLMVFAAQITRAQINFSGSYAENFNSILNTDGSGTTMSGVGQIGLQDSIPTLTAWRAARVAGTATGTFALFGDWGGSLTQSGTGRLYSYGLPASSERALGAVASGTTVAGFGTWFVNTSSDIYYSVTISFDREIWRTQTSAINQSLVFSYGLASTGIGTGNFLSNNLMTANSSLNATAPLFYQSLNGGTGGYTDPGTNAVTVTATIVGLGWSPGDSLFVRWNDVNDTGNDAGIAIDNLTMVAATPEPSTVLLGAMGIAAVALLRRKARCVARHPDAAHALSRRSPIRPCRSVSLF